MSAILSFLENLPSHCQLGIEGRVKRLEERQKELTDQAMADTKGGVVTNANIVPAWHRNTLFGDLNRAECLYYRGFNRRFDLYAIPNLLGAALCSLAAIPARLLRTIWHILALAQAIIPSKRAGAFDPLLEDLSCLAKTAVIAVAATALAIIKMATFIFTDGYRFGQESIWKNKPKKVLLIIDVQKDFEPGGRLAVPNGDEVVAEINKFIEKIKDDVSWRVVVSKDWHGLNHLNFAVNSGLPIMTPGMLAGIEQEHFWPLHCIQGSQGAELDPKLNLANIPKERLLVVKKGIKDDIDSYSAFQDNRKKDSKIVEDHTCLHENLQSWYTKEVVVVGLATDFCVKYSAQDAALRKFKVTVIKDGCRGIGTPPMSGDCTGAYGKMGKAGITLVENVDKYFSDP